MSAVAASILDQVLTPLTDSLTRESAERILRFKLEPDARGRVDELAAKAVGGTLSESERVEYTEFVDAMDLVGILQAKARDALLRQAR